MGSKPNGLKSVMLFEYCLSRIAFFQPIITTFHSSGYSNVQVWNGIHIRIIWLSLHNREKERVHVILNLSN